MVQADDRQERIGLNEALFREVNERIREIGDSLAAGSEDLDLVCECGKVECAERIRMTASEYERLRSDSTHFAVVPGHETPDVETVVERHKSYDVVRKREGDPARIAAETDPRR